MAPEIIESSKYDTKVDVYSFGILMYEVITDLTAYPELEKGKLSEFKFKSKVINDNYRPKFTTPLKKSLKTLIERCWSANPSDRPSFNEIFEKLTSTSSNYP